MNPDKYLFSSESVTEGHPDKMADQISDAILDSIISKDKNCRVACETLVNTGMVLIAGEITTDITVNYPEVVRKVIEDIGYCDPTMRFDHESCAVLTSIDPQSPDISIGVSEGSGKHKEQGAGDQGIMFGYATNETENLMPMPISYAHRLCEKLAEVRKRKVVDYLRPDGKSQVCVEYRNGKPARVDSVIIAAQHNPYDKSRGYIEEKLREDIKEHVIAQVIPEEQRDKNTKMYINETGRFVEGGPFADCGMTGRKIIVDTYGGMGRHGGGCFSGKDPSKVDRSASYMARYIAKNIVAAGCADKCEIQIGYVIGVAKPVSIFIDTMGTGKIPVAKIERLVKDIFPLKPQKIISHLDLLRPIYCQTAAYGHFGRDNEDFTWERTDMVEEIQDRTGL